MANMFKKGDIVQLKSGGPAMTVDAVPGIDPKFKHRPEALRGMTITVNGSKALQRPEAITRSIFSSPTSPL